MNKIIYYHERTKHHLDRLAKSPGYLDWENQPEPFRFYEGTEKIELPLLKEDPNCIYKSLYKTELCEIKKFSVDNISKFLELSLGISAWKSIPGSQWAVRMNPSSGNLHPTEGYLIIPDYDNLNGVFHYNPLLHALEKRADLTKEIASKIENYFGEGFFVALSSILWREAWKYGERAYRYCQLDIGHAIAAIRFAASLFGWKVLYLNAVSDEEIETILGFNKTQFVENEDEFAECLLFVYPANVSTVPLDFPESIVSLFANLDFKGKPNRLSKEHVRWDIIYEIAQIIKKPRTYPEKIKLIDEEPVFYAVSKYSAPEIIRKRRSAMAYDRKSYMPKDIFLNILDKTVPREKFSPFDVKVMPPAINLLLFVHRVEGLEKGLYFFFRYDKDREKLMRLLRKEFLWEKISDRLFLLYKGDFEFTAKVVSCKQDIASDSCFSLGMIANFKEIVEREPFKYRNIHWEAGIIGQSLYLDAEAFNFRGTGIGCFFDDVVHEILGLKDNTFHTVYHFTVGRHIDDPRIRSLPPYYYLEESRIKK